MKHIKIPFALAVMTCCCSEYNQQGSMCGVAAFVPQMPQRQAVLRANNRAGRAQEDGALGLSSLAPRVRRRDGGLAARATFENMGHADGGCGCGASGRTLTRGGSSCSRTRSRGTRSRSRRERVRQTQRRMVASGFEFVAPTAQQLFDCLVYGVVWGTFGFLGIRWSAESREEQGLPQWEPPEEKLDGKWRMKKSEFYKAAVGSRRGARDVQEEEEAEVATRQQQSRSSGTAVGVRACSMCDDVGMVKCLACKGKGFLFTDDVSPSKCGECQGAGTVMCAECDAPRRLPPPADDWNFPSR